MNNGTGKLLAECAAELDNVAGVMDDSEDQPIADRCADLAMRCREAVRVEQGLLKAASAALEYLKQNPPEGNVRKNFHTINHHANSIIKPLHDAIAKATGE
jgi:hypothetical protein